MAILIEIYFANINLAFSGNQVQLMSVRGEGKSEIMGP